MTRPLLKQPQISQPKLPRFGVVHRTNSWLYAHTCLYLSLRSSQNNQWSVFFYSIFPVLLYHRYEVDRIPICFSKVWVELLRSFRTSLVQELHFILKQPSCTLRYGFVQKVLLFFFTPNAFKDCQSRWSSRIYSGKGNHCHAQIPRIFECWNIWECWFREF